MLVMVTLVYMTDTGGQIAAFWIVYCVVTCFGYILGCLFGQLWFPMSY